MKKTIHYVIFFFLITSSLFSYIDPATGSMLFSALIGILASSYFLLKQIFMKLKFSSSNNKSEKNDFNSIVLFSEGAQYWNVFRPLLDGLVKAGEPCAFYTADENDPGLDYDSALVTTKYIGAGNKAYMKLNILESDICISTTPGLDVLLFKRSKHVKHYAHIMHSLNNTSTYRLFGLDYYDSVLINGPHQIGIIRELERLRKTKVKDIRIIGSTYLDCLDEKLKTIETTHNDDFTLLISPSWGPNGLLMKYGIDLLKPLADSGMKIIIRPHPQSSISEKELLVSLREQLHGYMNIEWDFSKDNLQTMIRADVMISDFSSIMFDFVFLFSKPVVVFNFSMDPRGFDLCDISEENPYYMVKDSGAVLHLDAVNFDEIPGKIKELTVNSKTKEDIEALKDLAWKYRGQSSVEGAKAIIDIRNKCRIS